MTAQEIIAQRARGQYGSCSRQLMNNNEYEGKRVEQPKRKSTWMIQLVVSAMLFAIIVGVKLTMPDVTMRYRDKALRLMGEEMDVAEVFSTVGQLVGSDTQEALENAYQAVFGAQEIEVKDHTVDRNAVVYSITTTPARTEMLQEVLGFPYADPVQGELTSAFGYRDHPTYEREKFHYGLDISAEKGTVISSFADGTVTAIGNSNEFGKYVEVEHADGYTTLYAHCSRITASSGQIVKMGDPIAEVGATGDATGDHLHFELHHGNVYLNPIYYVTC